jgi:hypothetical protein
MGKRGTNDPRGLFDTTPVHDVDAVPWREELVMDEKKIWRGLDQLTGRVRILPVAVVLVELDHQPCDLSTH